MASEYVTFDDLVRFHKEVIAPDLAAQLGALETRLEARFDKIDRRFEQVDGRFEQVDRRFEQIDRRFEQVDRQFNHINARLNVHDSQFDGQGERLDRLTGMVVSIDRRLQEGLTAQHDELVSTRRDMFKHFDDVYDMLHRTAADWDPWKQAIRDVEGRVTRLEKKRS